MMDGVQITTDGDQIMAIQDGDSVYMIKVEKTLETFFLLLPASIL